MGQSEQRGTLVILWKKNLLNLNFSFIVERSIGANADWKSLNYLFMNVYSPCTLEGKRKLWRSLIDSKNKLRARCWILGGDFNFVVCKEERNDAGDSRRDFEMIEFSSFVEEMDLIDVPSIDGMFTWINSAGP